MSINATGKCNARRARAKIRNGYSQRSYRTLTLLHKTDTQLHIYNIYTMNDYIYYIYTAIQLLIELFYIVYTYICITLLHYLHIYVNTITLRIIQSHTITENDLEINLFKQLMKKMRMMKILRATTMRK